MTTSTPLSFTVEEIWQQACVTLQQSMNPNSFNTWILSSPLTDFRLVGDNRAIGVITSPTAFHSTNMEKNFYAQIKEVLDKITGRNSELQFQIGEPSLKVSPTPPRNTLSPAMPVSSMQERLKEFAEVQKTNPPVATRKKTVTTQNDTGLFAPSTLQSMTVDRARLQAQRAGLRLDYTFDTFAVSTTNEMVHAAALAVSSQPGSAYNPLFIYGGVGVGKTHLMHAVGNNILNNNPEAKILYCTGEDFTNEIVSAIQNKKTMYFKEKFRNVDVLLIDDVQFIAGKNSVQEEFFHTFDTIAKRSGQIILTSDQQPHEIMLLEDRLRSRFQAGLMVDIQQPSFELRTAILLIKSHAYNLEIPMNLAQFIASKVDSARRIEGIIKTIKSEVELKHREISMELLNSIFAAEETKNKQRLHLKPYDVTKVVADFYHMKQIALRGQLRVKPLVNARHLAMYFMKEDLRLPFMEIGHWFSNRDHTSVMHAVSKIKEELMENEEFRAEATEIRNQLVRLSK